MVNQGKPQTMPGEEAARLKSETGREAGEVPTSVNGMPVDREKSETEKDPNAAGRAESAEDRPSNASSK